MVTDLSHLLDLVLCSRANKPKITSPPSIKTVFYHVPLLSSIYSIWLQSNPTPTTTLSKRNNTWKKNTKLRILVGYAYFTDIYVQPKK